MFFNCTPTPSLLEKVNGPIFVPEHNTSHVHLNDVCISYNRDNICISLIQTYEPPLLVEENLDQNAQYVGRLKENLLFCFVDVGGEITM